jgi:exopolysaccharide biosynthesis polyprenyl glycosylphosphotransferase
MLKEQSRLLTALTFVVDLALVALAFVAAHECRRVLLPALFPETFRVPFYSLDTYLPLLPIVLTIWGVLLLRTDSYRSHRTVPLFDEARDIFKICALGLAILALSIYGFRLDGWLLGADEISRPWIVLLALTSGVFLLGEKLLIRTLSRYVRARGFNYRTVLIVGINDRALELADAIEDHRYWGFKIIGFVRDPDSTQAEIPKRFPVLGTTDDLQRLVEGLVIDDVLFCVSRRSLDQMENQILALHEQGVRTRFALQLFPHAKTKTRLEELDGIPILTLATVQQSVLLAVVKRLMDIFLGLLMIGLALPIMALVALLIKMTEGGRVLYRQTRCGLNGRRFTLYKFRTMIEDAEAKQQDLLHLNEMDGPVFKMSSDPRVTWVGRFLRRFSLDELPQFWNVLRGDMSLVGPRPPIPDEVARYQRWQRRRLSMKPGLTCLWQISGRNQLDFERWMQLDLEYIDTWSPWLDLKILLKTVPAVLSGRGAS